MKRIGIIERLAERAERLGYAAIKRNGVLVYEVLYEKDSKVYTLRHYETDTIIYSKQINELIHWYGESVSDRDSMNTFLSYLGEHRYYFRYGPVMGFKMEEKEYERSLSMS